MAIEITAQDAGENSTQTKGGAVTRSSFLTSRIASKDRMFFTEQLALLIETGMPLHQALKVLHAQVTHPDLARIVEDISEELSGGKSFSQALEQHPKVFSSTYVNLVAASESGGFLHEVLSQLLQMEQRREELRSMLVSAFTYPGFLVVFSLLVVVFVLVFVFPKFGALFMAIEDELPVTTIVLLSVSDFLRHQWMLLIGILAGGGFLTIQQLRTTRGRRAVDYLKLKLPFVSSIFTRLYLVQALRVLSLSLANGVTIVDALRACRDVVDNHLFQGLMRNVETNVTQGGKIADGFAQSEFIPDLAKQMIFTAEEAGNLALVADRMAQYYQGELNKLLDRLSKIIEPVMLLVMGLVVGIIVSSLILPIFKLSHAVG